MDRNSSQHCLVSMGAGLLVGTLVFLVWGIVRHAPLGPCLGSGAGLGFATGTLWGMLALLGNPRFWMVLAVPAVLVALGALVAVAWSNPATGVKIPFVLILFVIRWALRGRS